MFFSIGMIYILGWIIFCLGMLFCVFKMFEIMPGLYSLDALESLFHLCDNHMCHKTFSNVSWGAKSPVIENYCLHLDIGCRCHCYISNILSVIPRKKVYSLSFCVTINLIMNQSGKKLKIN